MRLRYKIAANTTAQVVSRVVSTFSSFFITILIARYYGVEAFGDFIKITTFVTFFYLLADFGLNAITIKELGKSAILKPLQTLFATRITLGVGLSLLAIIISVFLPYSQETGFTTLVKLGIAIFAPTIFLQALIRSANAIFQFKLRYEQATIAVSTGSIFSLILVLLFVILKANSILWIIGALFVSKTLVSTIAILLAKKTVSIKKLAVFSTPAMIQLIKKALPLGLVLALNIAFFRLDTFLLAIFRPTKEVGLYGLAYKFFEFPLIIPTFFMNALYPILATNNKQGIKHKGINIKKIAKQSAVFLAAGSLLLTIILWALAPYISLVKSSFAGSVFLLRILSLWLPLFFLSSLSMWILIAKEKYWLLAKIYALGLLVNAVLNLALIPSYGAIAAAATTGATEAVILILLTINLINIL